jgi:hypothetical protein
MFLSFETYFECAANECGSNVGGNSKVFTEFSPHASGRPSKIPRSNLQHHGGPRVVTAVIKKT